MNNNQNNNISNSPNPNNINNMQPIMPNGLATNNVNMNQANPAQMGNIQNNNANNNKFINYNETANETAINNLNVEGTYNQLDKKPEYTNEPQVRQNIQVHTKKTIPVTKELKTVIVIAAILLIFIIFIPMIFEFVNSIRFR